MTHSAQTCHLNTWQGLVPSSASPLPCSQMSLAWENSWLFATPPLVSPGKYRKIPKISPGHILFKGPFWGAYFWRGLSKEGNLRFTIDWANHIVRSKFTVFALFYFVFEGNIPSTSPRGTYIILEGRFNGGLFALPDWGLILNISPQSGKAKRRGGGILRYDRGMTAEIPYWWRITTNPDLGIA